MNLCYCHKDGLTLELETRGEPVTCMTDGITEQTQHSNKHSITVYVGYPGN